MSWSSTVPRSSGAPIDEALAGGHAQRHMTIGGRTYSLIANPVHEGEEVIGAVIVLLDITEQEQREQLRREFTANVSHELKTPLTSHLRLCRADEDRHSPPGRCGGLLGPHL